MVRTLLAFAIGILIATGFLFQRSQWLHSFDLRLTYPPVPPAITTQVRQAETAYYAGQPMWRRILEDMQDIVTFASPSLTTRLDFSLGPYRIKASTFDEILPFALENDYITLIEVPDGHALDAISYFAEQPEFADWGAAVFLEYLRRDHPELSQMEWSEIGTSPMLIAKLYSGYMGAGGDWDLWRSNINPGPNALARMGLLQPENTE